MNYYSTNVIILPNYYSFGMLQRSGQSTDNNYRYGFQGQEEDKEVKSDGSGKRNGNSINYKFRMHDPRLGRFFAVDPLASKYPHNSVYAFSENRVTDGVELEGLEYEATEDTDGNITGGIATTDGITKQKAIDFNQSSSATNDSKIFPHLSFSENQKAGKLIDEFHSDPYLGYNRMMEINQKLDGYYKRDFKAGGGATMEEAKDPAPVQMANMFGEGFAIGFTAAPVILSSPISASFGGVVLARMSPLARYAATSSVATLIDGNLQYAFNNDIDLFSLGGNWIPGGILSKRTMMYRSAFSLADGGFDYNMNGGSSHVFGGGKTWNQAGLDASLSMSGMYMMDISKGFMKTALQLRMGNFYKQSFSNTLGIESFSIMPGLYIKGSGSALKWAGDYEKK